MNRQTIDDLAKMAIANPPFTANGRFPPSTYYRFLYELARYKKANLSVVLGVCGGGCCYNLAKKSKSVIGIDIDKESYVDNHKFITDNCPNVTFLYGDSIELASGFEQEIDILFIDTIHEYARTLDEFAAWKPHLADDAIVCLDDLYRGGMMAAYDYLVEYNGDGYRNKMLHLGGSPNDGCFGVIWNIK
jgi:predicted O-methyltransferase YrrM